MKRLFIAEKPELARAIVEGLGGGEKKRSHFECGDDVVTWCIGHMIELWEPQDYDEKFKHWRLEDLPIHNAPIKYKPKENTAEQLKAIIELMSDAESIVHAGDPDSEGQLIVDELIEYAEFDKPVLRFMTNDLNTKIVKKALANLQDNRLFYNQYQAALARNLGDQLYGFNMSRAYTVAAQNKGYDGMLPVGRVQTPILGLVVNRDRLNSGHQKSYYYEVFGKFTFGSCKFKAKAIIKDESKLDEKNRITDKALAENISEMCSEKKTIIISNETKIKRSNPPLPYNMINIQADAARLFNYKPTDVMEITQVLREKHKLITYNGSDCQYLNEEQHADAPAVLAAINNTAPVLSTHILNCDSAIQSRAFNNKNVSAHHAIIPTETVADIEVLDEKSKNIYILIANKYIAQFMPLYEYKETILIVDVNGQNFKTSSKITTTEGWRNLLGKSEEPSEDNDIDEPTTDLAIIEGLDGFCDKAECLSRETKPQALYKMETLLKDLTRVSKYVTNPDIKRLLISKDKDKKGEHGGIGTSRTRDRIITKLFDLGYIADSGKNVVSTKLGQQFFDTLPNVATRPDMTALWHEQQKSIENGAITREQFIAELMRFIGHQIEHVKKNGINIHVEKYECTWCKNGILKKRRRKKDLKIFWICTNSPACKASTSNKSGKPDLKSLVLHKCDNCSKPLKRRKKNEENGHFWSCTGYPECKNTLNDKNGKPVKKQNNEGVETEFKCKCGSKLVKRKSKKKIKNRSKTTIWYGCSNFPECKGRYYDKKGSPDYGK